MNAIHFSPKLNRMAKCSNPPKCKYGSSVEDHIQLEDVSYMTAEEYLGVIYSQRKKHGIDPRADKIDPENTGLSESESNRLLAIQGFNNLQTLQQEQPKKTWEQVAHSEENKKYQNFLDNKRSQESTLNDKEFIEHEKFVADKVQELYDNDLTTDKMYSHKSVNGFVIFNEEREELHDQIIAEITSSWDDVPSNAQAIIAGGTGGAGKSYILELREGVDVENTGEQVVINPDIVKEKLAEKGMIPHVDGLTPMEASPIVHEEASHISERLLKRALKEKKNLVIDMTCKDLKVTEEKLNQLEDSGYKEIKAVFVDVDVQTTAENARNRHRKHFDTWMLKDGDDRGYGGRFLPAFVNNQSKPSPGSLHHSRNAEVITSLYHKGYIDSLKVYDNNNETIRDVAGVMYRVHKEPVEVSQPEFFSRSKSINNESKKALTVPKSPRKKRKEKEHKKAIENISKILGDKSFLAEKERDYTKSLPDL